MTAAIAVICATFGLVVGSFLNVVIYRVPRQLSVVAPPSACPNCHEFIKPYDNVPLFSWLVLRGKCRNCHNRISVRYPLVELVTAALFAGTALRLGHSWAIPAYCALLAGILALALIDLDHLKLPKRLVWIHLAIVGVLLTSATAQLGQWRHLLIGLLCAVVWSGTFYAINFFSPKMMGFGDVRFVLVLGLALGWLSAADAVLGFFLSNFIGLVVTLPLVIAKKLDMQQRLPYGVFLTAGTIVAFYFGPNILRPFHLT